MPLDYQISMIFGLGRDLFLHVHKRPVCVWATRLVILSSLDIPYYYYFFWKDLDFLKTNEQSIAEIKNKTNKTLHKLILEKAP